MRRIITLAVVLTGLLVLLVGAQYAVAPTSTTPATPPLATSSAVGERSPGAADATAEEPSAAPAPPEPLTIKLSAEQRAALEKYGVESAHVPREFSAEQTACFVETLGAERVHEIQAGAMPSFFAGMRAAQCL